MYLSSAYYLACSVLDAKDTRTEKEAMPAFKVLTFYLL